MHYFKLNILNKLMISYLYLFMLLINLFLSKNLLATSSSSGKVQIWQLPSFMLKLQTDEMQQLQSLSKTTE